jgi:hypothetical protein
MKLNQKIVAGGAVAVIAMLGLGGAAMAATSNTTHQDSLAQKIADKFHLNKSDVQSVIEQNHQDKQAKHEQMLKDKLDQAVKDGKLTQAQEDKLIAKLKELHDQKKTDNKADRKADRKAAHDELQQWAKDNGIDLSQVLPHPDGPGHHHSQ